MQLLKQHPKHDRGKAGLACLQYAGFVETDVLADISDSLMSVQVRQQQQLRQLAVS